jgi:hypothetical protein
MAGEERGSAARPSTESREQKEEALASVTPEANIDVFVIKVSLLVSSERIDRLDRRCHRAGA